MQQINHENNLITVAASTAKECAKKLARYRLFAAMAAACVISPAAFLVYFIVRFSAVGIWSFSITLVLAAAAATVLFIVTVPRYKAADAAVKNFASSGGELKKAPALDVFCITTVKVLFTVMAALLVCAVPTLITVCFGKTLLETLTYMANCLGAFWGMNTGVGGFFAYVVGLGLMAAIFALLLLIIKFVSKLLK